MQSGDAGIPRFPSARLPAHLDKYLEERRLAARQQTPLALLMIDADHFKDFNDRFGHQAGDECLRAIASTLTAHASRPGDVVARFGGEEFVILLPDTPLDGARHVAEKLRAAVFDLAIAHLAVGQPAAETRRITVSVGCAALVPRPEGRYQQLVELADQALYLAKRAGRNRVCVAESDAHAWLPGTAARKLRARIEAIKLQRSGGTVRNG